MQLFEFLIVLGNVFILSTIYTTIVFVLLFLLSRLIQWNLPKRVMSKKLVFAVVTHLLISIGLLVFSFSYWQNTGLGDNSRIPIGYGQTIQSEDFARTYFYPDLSKTEPNRDEVKIENYIVTKEKLCAELSLSNGDDSSHNFIVYDLPSKTYKIFKTERQYSDYANLNSLPQRIEFYDFKKHYNEFLQSRSALRTWLLP